MKTLRFQTFRCDPEANLEVFSTNKNFALFVFGRQEGWEKVTPFKEKKGFTFPILPDLDKTVYDKFATKYIPRNILIDQSGKIIYQSMGYDEKEFTALLNLIENQLKQANSK